MTERETKSVIWPTPKHPDEINEVVAREFGLPVERMKMNTHAWQVAKPRFVAMYLMHRFGLSFCAIGRYYGRHHTTAMYGVRKGESHPASLKIMEKWV